MPSFLSQLRRKGSRGSKTSNKHDHLRPDEVADGQNGHGMSHRVSSSTLNSSPVGSTSPSTTPATSTTEEVHTHGPTPLPVRSPTRAQRPSVEPIKRYSMNVGHGQMFRRQPLTLYKGISTTSNGSHSSVNKSSLLAPRVISVSDGSWVRIVVLTSKHWLTSGRYINKFYSSLDKLANQPTGRWTALLRLTTTKADSRPLVGPSVIPTSRL